MHFLDPVLNAADPRLHLCFIYLPVDEGRTDGRTEMRTRGEKDTLIRLCSASAEWECIKGASMLEMGTLGTMGRPSKFVRLIPTGC